MPSEKHLDRSELIQRLVLDSICDDYENVDQCILRDVAEWGAKCGLTISRAEVVKALAELVDRGLAKAYDLSLSQTELQSIPSIECIEENFKTYFYITKKGMDLHLSDDAGWPFDDDGNPLP